VPFSFGAGEKALYSWVGATTKLTATRYATCSMLLSSQIKDLSSLRTTWSRESALDSNVQEFETICFPSENRATSLDTHAVCCMVHSLSEALLMTLQTTEIRRRDFLKFAGVSVALPFLEGLPSILRGRGLLRCRRHPSGV